MWNVVRQERIAVLERNISEKIEQDKLNSFIQWLQEKGVPDSEFADIKTFKEVHTRFTGHFRTEYYYAYTQTITEYMEKERGLSIPQKILSNIATTREKVSWIGKDTFSDPDYRRFCISRIKSDPAYQTLSLLWDAVDTNQGALSGFWEDAEEMGKEMTQNFLSDCKEDLLARRKFFGEECWERVPDDLTMEEQYDLLVRMRKTPDDIQKQIFQKVCLILPSYFGADFHWSQVQEIVDAFPVIQDTQDMIQQEPEKLTSGDYKRIMMGALRKSKK